MSNVIELTDSSFENEVKEGVTLVDFWAPWCGPCRMQHPILDNIAEKELEGLKIAKVNVDDCPNIASQFGIQSIPTIMVIKNGAEVARRIGVTQEKTLIDLVENA